MVGNRVHLCKESHQVLGLQTTSEVICPKTEKNISTCNEANTWGIINDMHDPKRYNRGNVLDTITRNSSSRKLL